jgi:hypothetical protein
MLEVPIGLNLIFILTTLITYIMLVFSMMGIKSSNTDRSANIIAILLLLWIIFQSTLALNMWFMDRKSMPPHMFFPLITWLLLLTAVFTLKKPRIWTEKLSAELLTWIHIVRIPVEIGLFQLAQQKQVPWSMTFKGLNFDLIFGITAPIVAILFFRMKILNNQWMKIWNYAGLISVCAVVLRGIGSLPSPIQWWDFSQPNYAVMHFPFIWLPSFIVPVVIFSHIVLIRRMRRV